MNEDTVREEMAAILDADPDDLEISDSMLESFSAGEAMTVELGRQEYTVVPDEDTARDIAIAVVTQDLEDEPELFEANFIEGHIDMDALSKWVYDANMEDDYADDIAQSEPERFWEEMESWGLDVPEFEEDEDGDEIIPDPDYEHIEALKEAIAKDRAGSPMQYLEEFYSPEEARKKAIEVAGIDVESAAEEAVSVDGWAHFLARYDGNYDETESGLVYWRDN